MPSNKFFYDGSVVINNAIDNLDLSGWINRRVASATNRGAKSITLVSTAVGVISVGDILVDSLTNNFIGKVKSIKVTLVEFEKPIEIPLAANAYVHVYPKFEIVKIQILGFETYITELVPVETQFPGSLLPDRGTWSSYTKEDFGAVDGDGTAFSTGVGVLPAGTEIEGRFKRIQIDNAGVAISHSAVCYLKATPLII